MWETIWPNFFLLVLFFFLFCLLDNECSANEMETFNITTTTTAITTGLNQTDFFSVGAITSENGSITGLTPGSVYQIFFISLNCCKEVTTG